MPVRLHGSLKLKNPFIKLFVPHVQSQEGFGRESINLTEEFCHLQLCVASSLWVQHRHIVIKTSLLQIRISYRLAFVWRFEKVPS